MTETPDRIRSQDSPATASDWVKILAGYREPCNRRSAFELAVTAGAFLALWALAWAALSVSLFLAFAVALCIAPFLLRLFAIQHDCGHSSFFTSRQAGDWVGRGLGILTLTPYDVWRRSHSIHHGASGDLSRRGIGDVLTLTVGEYAGRTRFGRLRYRLYRHPVVLFGLGPAYVYLLGNRLPLGLMGQSRYWVSSMGTNAGILLLLAGIWYVGGLAPILLIFLPSTLLAATAGVWLFYVQHQFETAHWENAEDWRFHDSALHGSSHYVLPSVLRWLTANIGVHHVHHLYSRIPFYRLTDVLRDHAVLATCNRMSIRQSLDTVRLRLWDEDSKRMMSFAEARALRA
jgi:omega-6 fatty acid desaturase (delta-12 desaturase)